MFTVTFAFVVATTLLLPVGAMPNDAAAQRVGRVSAASDDTVGGELKSPAVTLREDVRIAVSLEARTLWVIAGSDTLRSASVAVAMALSCARFSPLLAMRPTVEVRV